MKIMHSASLGLVDRCNVIVLLGISANQIDSEDSGGRKGVSVGSGWSGNWWSAPKKKLNYIYQQRRGNDKN